MDVCGVDWDRRGYVRPPHGFWPEPRCFALGLFNDKGVLIDIVPSSVVKKPHLHSSETRGGSKPRPIRKVVEVFSVLVPAGVLDYLIILIKVPHNELWIGLVSSNLWRDAA